MGDSDDDIPQLSPHALAALQEFYDEQQQRKINPREDNKYNIGIIEENWQLSQFWYNEETALRLATEAIMAAGKGGSSHSVTLKYHRNLQKETSNESSVL